MHLPVPINPINSILGFFDYARTSGLYVGLGEAESAVSAAELELITNRTKLKYGMKAICCGSVDDICYESLTKEEKQKLFNASKK